MVKYISGLLVLACLSCNNDNKISTAREITETNKLTQSSADVKVGGLYSIKNKDGSYYVIKVLAKDEYAIHLRAYANQFHIEPLDLNSDTLSFQIGHLPMSYNGFLMDKPKLVRLEEVKESELEGYRIYLKAMKEQ